MKKLITVTLLVCLCAQCVVKLSILAWYNLNKEHITALYCENKAKPQLHCEGKCHLGKQLAKASLPGNNGNEKSPVVKSLEKTFEAIVLQQPAMPQPYLPGASALYFNADDFLQGRSTAPVFRPPSAVRVS